MDENSSGLQAARIGGQVADLSTELRQLGGGQLEDRAAAVHTLVVWVGPVVHRSTYRPLFAQCLEPVVKPRYKS
jgi:hypothetical protein